MEIDETQTQACKFTRISNGRINSSRLNHHPEEEDDGDHLHHPNQQLQLVNATGGADDGRGGSNNRLRGWQHHSSRIIRVSRASGGKDRHSKVWTSKGLRDRRVRLSVSTAIQFYDLQDRLGYDQPSKAVEWLIKAAADAIAQLPSLNTSFPDTPRQLSDENRRPESEDQQGAFDSAEMDCGDQHYQQQHNSQNHQQQPPSLSKTSACSSNSETSKGSGLSLSRSDVRVNRVKARERARERAAKEKEKEKENVSNHIPQSSSFTELLTNGIGAVHNNNGAGNGNDTSPPAAESGEPSFYQRPIPMDYFNTGLIGPPSTSSSTTSTRPQQHFLGQIQLGNSSNSLPQTLAIPSFVNPLEMQQQHHFSFVNPEHLIPTAAGAGGGDYNLNFNRGTLQSNSSSSLLSLLPHFQRLASSSSSSPIDGSSLPFLIGATPQPPPPPPVENHQHHHHQFPAGLHLYYGDESRHSDKAKPGN